MARTAAQALKDWQTQVDNGLRQCADTTQGRAFLWWLFEQTNAFSNPFSPSNPHLTAFGCGEQNVGQKLLVRLMEVSPETWLTMTQEQKLKELLKKDEIHD